MQGSHFPSTVAIDSGLHFSQEVLSTLGVWPGGQLLHSACSKEGTFPLGQGSHFPSSVAIDSGLHFLQEVLSSLGICPGGQLSHVLFF